MSKRSFYDFNGHFNIKFMTSAENSALISPTAFIPLKNGTCQIIMRSMLTSSYELVIASSLIICYK
jgi:hypothetical protein